MSRSARRRPRRSRRWLVLLMLAAGAAVAWPQVQRQEVFTVGVVHLKACPDHLRPTAYEALEPLLGGTFLDVLRRSPAIAARLETQPEVASATIRCVPPHFVELTIVPRVPQYAVPAPGGWLNVDGEGVIVRRTPRPAAGLTRLHGVAVGRGEPGTRVKGPAWLAATAARAAADVVLGRPPHTVAIEPGPSVRLRTATGGLVLLGSATDLESKLRWYQVVCNRLEGPARYIDVSVPEAPAWVPGP